MEVTYFRKGFGLKDAIGGQLASDYASAIVDLLRARNHTLEVGPVTFRLAREFGFCYGVDRAVDYAYETRLKFPERQLYLVGEICDVDGRIGGFNFQWAWASGFVAGGA